MFGRRKATPRSQELVFLDTDDDLGTIRSKLEASTAEENYLVIPNRSPVLKTPLEYRMLARIANEVSSETILVSGDPARRRMAQQEGFRTKSSLRSLRHLMLAPGQRRPLFYLPEWVPSIGALLGTVIPLALLIIGALIVLPQIRVRLVPQQTQLDREVEITVDPSVQTADPARQVLPGEVLREQFEVSGSLPIPAERTVGQEQARGSVVITSTRTEEFTLPRGTRVRVPNGPQFTIDADTRIPPRVPVTVGITAVEAGPPGNVEAGAITMLEGVPGENLEVVNRQPTQGGSDRPGRIVTAADHQALEQQLLQQARDRGYAELRSRAGADRTVPESTFQVQPGQVSFDQQPGAETERLTGRMTVTATATAFDNLGFNELAGQILARSAGRQARLRDDPELGVPAVIDTQGPVVRLRVRVEGIATQPLNEDQIAQDLRGSTLEEARVYVQQLTSGLAQPPQVEMSPSWAPRAFRVSVEVVTPQG